MRLIIEDCGKGRRWQNSMRVHWQIFNLNSNPFGGESSVYFIIQNYKRKDKRKTKKNEANVAQWSKVSDVLKETEDEWTQKGKSGPMNGKKKYKSWQLIKFKVHNRVYKLAHYCLEHTKGLNATVHCNAMIALRGNCLQIKQLHDKSSSLDSLMVHL